MAKTPTEIASLARQHTARAIEVLQGIMDSPGSQPQNRIAAAIALLNRGWGMPQVTVDSEVVHRYVIEAHPQLSSEEWEKKYGEQTIQ